MFRIVLPIIAIAAAITLNSTRPVDHDAIITFETPVEVTIEVTTDEVGTTTHDASAGVTEIIFDLPVHISG